MAGSNVRGMSELIKLFDTLPAEAEAAIKEVLPEAAANILALQKGDVPIRTGDLWRGLQIQTLDDGLKVRVGLIGNTDVKKGRTGLNGLFYGRVVEYGRHAQKVRYQRQPAGGRVKRRRGKKIAGDLTKFFTMEVSATPPRPFVDTAATQAASAAALEAIATAISNSMKE